MTRTRTCTCARTRTHACTQTHGAPHPPCALQWKDRQSTHVGREKYLDWDDRERVAVLAAARMGVMSLQGNKTGEGGECRLCGDGEETEAHLVMCCGDLLHPRARMTAELDVVEGGAAWRQEWECDGGVAVMAWMLGGGGGREEVWAPVVDFLVEIVQVFKGLGVEVMGAEEGGMERSEALGVIEDIEKDLRENGRRER